MKRNLTILLVALIAVMSVGDAAAKTPRKRHSTTRTTSSKNVNKLADNISSINGEATIESQLECHEKVSKLLTNFGGKNGANGAIKALEHHAEKLSEGSTYDMVMSARIDYIISKYRSMESFKKLRKDPSLKNAVDNEMQAWLALDENLSVYVSQIAFVENWGGTLAQIIAAGNTMQLQELRSNDLKRLVALKPTSSPGTIYNDFNDLAKLFAENIVENKPEYDDEMEEYEEGYPDYYNEMGTTAVQVIPLIQAWIDARKELALCFENPTDVYYATDSFIKSLNEVLASEE